MIHFIFNKDNYYSWHGAKQPPKAMVDGSIGQFTVAFPDSIFQDCGIPDDEHSNIIYSPTLNSIELDVERMVLPSKRALVDLRERLTAYKSIPEDERDPFYPELLFMCAHFLPQDIVDGFMEDGLLSVDEVNQALKML
jgi:hypothetical protein